MDTMTVTGKKHQELKDKLWRLDEDVELLTAEITRRTGEAWKSAVEHENYRKHLRHALNFARDLMTRIDATLNDLD